MGQAASQTKDEEGYDSNDNTVKQESSQNHHAASDIAFSSQVPGLSNPSFPTPRPPTTIKNSSSPTTRFYDSQASTPVTDRKMADSSPYQFPTILGLSVDANNQTDQYAQLPQSSKKKRRNKKRSSSISHPDNDYLNGSGHDDQEQEANINEVNGGDNSVINGNTYRSSQVHNQVRDQQKRDRKEMKRAAKLAKQQAAASSALGMTEKPSRFAELWDAQEHAIPAKYEHIEESDPVGDLDSTLTNLEDAADPLTIASKKRKRKAQAQAQAQDALQQSPKKHKRSHSGITGVTAKNPGNQTQIGSAENPEVSIDKDINFNDLAEQLYSGRKKKSHHNIETILKHTATEDAARAESENNKHMEDMDVDNGSINDIAIREARDDSESISISRVESDLIANEQAESAESDNEVEMYQDDDIDKDYDDENVDNNIHSVVAESPTSRVSNRHQSSASLKNRKRSAREASNKALFTFGTTQQDVVGSGEDTAVGVNRKAIPYNINGISDEDSEVPSSVPRPSSAGEASAHRNATTTVSSGRKRVVKPDFFSRVVEEDDNKNDFQSPTAAALSRKKDKGKQVATLQYDTEAGPSVTNGKSKQPKITGVLGDNASVDGDDAGTPLTQSVVRLRTPKAPVTLSGVFSDFELRNLSQAIERYREDNGKTQYEVNELIHSNPKDSKTGELWECIMATCPGRSRQKVINQTRRRFHNFVARGTWTPEQEQELKQMYDQYGNKYALIGQLINRHPEDIRDRIRNYLICGDKQRKDQWSQEEQDQLIAIVEQAIAQIHQERVKRGDMSDRPVEEDINWQLVSQGMGRTRSRLQCISKWKAVKPQLAGGGLDGETAPIEEIIQKARETATTMSYRNRFLIVKAILRTGASADSRIPWLKVRTELSLKWTRPPLMVVWFRLRRTLPNWQTLNVKEICTLLIQNFQHTHMLEYPSEENSDLDFDAEYREIEYKIKRGRKSGTSAKSPAIVTKNNDDDDDEAIRDQLDATGEEATEEALVSHHHRRSSVDLGVGSIGEDEPEVEDSEPEVHTRRRRSTRSRGNHIELQEGVSDSQSSDTNASQVSSIPAR